MWSGSHIGSKGKCLKIIVGETASPINAKFNELINYQLEIWFDKDDVIGHVVWQPYWIKEEKNNLQKEQKKKEFARTKSFSRLDRVRILWILSSWMWKSWPFTSWIWKLENSKVVASKLGKAESSTVEYPERCWRHDFEWSCLNMY